MMDFRLYNTRVRIVAGMLACMKEKPFRELKDKDIIAKAQVSPRTFYHYYKDRNDLLDLLEKHMLEGLQEAMARDFEAVKALHGAPDREDVYELADPAFKHVLEFCEENKEAAQVLLSDNGDIRFERKVKELSIAEFKKGAKYLTGNPDFEIDDPVFLESYVTKIFSLIEYWLMMSDIVAPRKIREYIGKVQVQSPFDMLQEQARSSRSGTIRIENAY